MLLMPRMNWPGCGEMVVDQDGKQSGSPRHSKGMKRRTSLFAVLFIIVMAGLVLGLIPTFTEPCQEMVGATSIQAWVPVYVLYDPPGNGSNAELSRSGSGEMTITFEGTLSGREVIGGYNGAVITATFGTPDELRWHGVVAIPLNQTWEVWRCSSGSVDWLEARLVSCNGHGSGFFTATEIEEYNIWMDNLTGTSSPHGHEWNLAQGGTAEATFTFSREGFFHVGAGYNITLLGFDFSVRVWLNVRDCSLVTSYVFNNVDGPLNFTILSSGRITQLSDEAFETDGLLLWFDE